MSNLSDNEFVGDVCLVDSKDLEIKMKDFAKQADVLLLDRFTTDAASVTLPRTCEPLGTLSGVDTGNKLSISGGKLTAPSFTTGFADPRVFTGLLTRRAGLAAYGKFSVSANNAAVLGWAFTGSTAPNNGIQMATSGSIVLDNNGGVIFPNPGNNIALSTEYELLVIQRSAGAFAFIKGGAFSNWTLLWLFYPRTENNFFIAGASGVSGEWSGDDFAVFQLYSNWLTDYGIATTHIAAPTTGATGTMTANGFISFSWTPAAAEVLELDIRFTDANNRWVIRCDQAGSTMKLIERNTGVETERSSAAQTWTAGNAYFIQIVAVDSLIRSFANNVLKNNYASSTFNQTATSLRVSGFATGANLAAFPRTLSGEPAIILDSAIASLDQIN